MTTHSTEILLSRARLLSLVRTGALALNGQSTAAHSVRVDVRIVLDPDVRDDATVRAMADALTDDLAHRYERGWNVEEQRYEPGSSEWVGMLVSNADRILVTESGMTLAEVNDEQKRLYVERLLRGEEEIRYARGTPIAQRVKGEDVRATFGTHEWKSEYMGAPTVPPPSASLPPLPLGAVGRGGGEPLTSDEEARMRKLGFTTLPVSRATGMPAAVPTGDATIIVSHEAADALHVNGVSAGRYEPRSQQNCTTVLLAAEALLIHEASRVARRPDVLELREVSFCGGMLSLALTKGTHLTAKQSGWLEQLFMKARRVEASNSGKLIRHAAPDVIKCERFVGLAEVK